MDFRIGFGFDVHQLKKNRKLVLGGVHIPYHKGALAHSDGDVLLHAICDAMLGAVALGDIGVHFPDDSEEYKDIDSRVLLRKTRELIGGKQFSVHNVDAVICLENPKIKGFIGQMKELIAEDLGIRPERISVKATTTEKLGFTGKGKGITASAVVLLSPAGILK
jgi:2-C-methyl-D-erythritol 2,4-cyclodiphosphate synthase